MNRGLVLGLEIVPDELEPGQYTCRQTGEAVQPGVPSELEDPPILIVLPTEDQARELRRQALIDPTHKVQDASCLRWREDFLMSDSCAACSAIMSHKRRKNRVPAPQELELSDRDCAFRDRRAFSIGGKAIWVVNTFMQAPRYTDPSTLYGSASEERLGEMRTALASQLLPIFQEEKNHTMHPSCVTQHQDWSARLTCGESFGNYGGG